MRYLGEEDAPRILKIRNEVKLSHDLDRLNMGINNAVQRAINFAVNIVGKKTPSQKMWENIGKSINDSNLTEEGKIKLKYRHELFEDYVKPKPKPLAYALLPLIILWVAKSVWAAKMHERKIEKILERKRKQRQKEKSLATRRR